jgi:hypothetical protein
MLAITLFVAWLTVPGQAMPAAATATTSLRFSVSVADGLLPSPQSGRLFIVVSRDEKPEPRSTIGRTGLDTPPVFARDIDRLGAGITATLGEDAIAFPIAGLASLPAGDYFVQAVYDINQDLRSLAAPGNLYSAVTRVALDPARGGTVNVVLTSAVPPEELPADTEFVKYVRLRSELLSAFHGRTIYLRAGVILPRTWQEDSARRYPLRVRIGGYGARFTGVQRMMSEKSEFRKTWESENAPQMIVVHLDGDGPLGDPYQVNSANHGPYGDAVTQELIPFVERTWRGIGDGSARVVDGGSTGGWVSLALQIFYPDFFTGAWSYCPDGVDFRGFQLVNVYEDANAYVNRRGFERPSARELNGDVRFTMRHELQMENMLGRGDSWTMSGGQWGAWNATYGARGSDGRPVPLWDPGTGEIDRTAADHWKQYDLRMILERDWPQLAPKLAGKINIWVGEADNYFLNNAVHMLDESLAKVQPPYGGRIVYGPGRGHCWVGLTEREIVQEMGAAFDRGRR